jgi:opacity protein-like surface antigen
MGKRRILGAVAAALACSALAPASASAVCNPDLYSGVWTVGSSHRESGRTVRVTYGPIVFTLHGDETTLTGTYSFSGPGGSLTAQLSRACGRSFSGSYTDGGGSGQFEATLNSDSVSFDGRARPCFSGCKWLPWWGERA